MKKISEIMTREVHIAHPDHTLEQIASIMSKEDIGSVPVGDNDRLVGIVTDRDIVLRGVANGRGADAKVREVMTDRIRYCYEDQDVAEVARNMADLGVRRLPVLNRDKRIVGIVALSNIVQSHDGAKTNSTFLDGVATPH